MIRKNDSETYIGKWGKTITPKRNWHISNKSIYTEKRIKSGEKKKFQKNIARFYMDNWGYRAIGVHYADGQTRYVRQVRSVYSILKEITRILRKRGFSVISWSIHENLQFKDEKSLLEAIPLVKSLANKYGLKISYNKEFIEHFPNVYVKKVRDVYEYPLL